MSASAQRLKQIAEPTTSHVVHTMVAQDQRQRLAEKEGNKLPVWRFGREFSKEPPKSFPREIKAAPTTERELLAGAQPISPPRDSHRRSSACNSPAVSSATRRTSRTPPPQPNHSPAVGPFSLAIPPQKAEPTATTLTGVDAHQQPLVAAGPASSRDAAAPDTHRALFESVDEPSPKRRHVDTNAFLESEVTSTEPEAPCGCIPEVKKCTEGQVVFEEDEDISVSESSSSPESGKRQEPARETVRDIEPPQKASPEAGIELGRSAAATAVATSQADVPVTSAAEHIAEPPQQVEDHQDEAVVVSRPAEEPRSPIFFECMSQAASCHNADGLDPTPSDGQGTSTETTATPIPPQRGTPAESNGDVDPNASTPAQENATPTQESDPLEECGSSIAKRARERVRRPVDYTLWEKILIANTTPKRKTRKTPSKRKRATPQPSKE